MNSLAPLLKVQLLGAFGIGRLLNERDPKARHRLALAATGVALLAMLAVGYAWIIGSQLSAVGAANALPALAVAVSGVGCVFSTFVKANGLLFGFKDFDLVVTMPAPIWAVAVSRTAPLYGMGLALSALMGGPLMAAYLLAVGAGPADVAAAAIVLMLAPAIPVAASVACSFAVAWAASRTAHASRALGIAGVAATVAIVVCVMAATGGMESGGAGDLRILASAGSLIEEAVVSFWPPAAWASAAIGGDAVALALYAAVSAATCVATIALLSRLIVPLNSLLASGGARRSVKARAVSGAERTPLRAMVAKELRLWIATPIYLMNTAAGPALALVAAIAAAVAGPQILASAVNVPGADREALAGMMAGAFPWVLAFFMAMTSLSASSTSLEGSARWIAQTAPVPASTLVASKIAANLAVTAPASLVAGSVTAFALSDGPASAALMFVAPLAGAALSSCLGALLDARRPRFDWASTYEPVKRSANVAICIGAGFALVAAGIFATMNAGTLAGLAVACAAAVAAALAGRSAMRIPMQDR